MEKMKISLLLFWGLIMVSVASVEFRVNHVGYGVNDVKYGFLCQFGAGSFLDKEFELLKDGSVVYTGTITIKQSVANTPFDALYICDFSSVKKKGMYQLRVDGILSEKFSIGAEGRYENVLQTIHDFYRAQRCGTDDALLHEACHLNDATAAIDCSGGWHDAGDYIKFMVTSSFVALEMLVTCDYLQSYGMEKGLLDKNGQTGIPDILEEARVGIEWILKMTSDIANKNLYFQVSGQEDHKYWRIPEEDDKTGNVGNPRTLHKGWGLNLTGRSAAVLALGAKLWEKHDKAFADACLARALEIWEVRGEYKEARPSEPESFYNESSTDDDMLLAAALLYEATGDETYQSFMKRYFRYVKGYNIGWSGVGFLSIATCYRLGFEKEAALDKMKYVLDFRLEKSQEHPFLRSSSLSWGTNAYYPSEAQMAIMFKMLTGDDTYMEMAQHQRNYLLGANNWDMSFVVGVGYRYPLRSHSQLNDLVDLHRGAVVGGPAAKSSWENILTLPTSFHDPYNKYQSDVVYYDWIGDYYTNEVSIDYAAAALFIMSYYYGDVDGTTGVIHADMDNAHKNFLKPIQNGRDFQFHLSGQKLGTMDVCDMRGRVLQSVALHREGVLFSGSVSQTISSGIYILRIVSDKYTQKVRVYLP